MKREDIVKNLQRSVLFQDAGESELAAYAELARVQIFSQGQYVYREGDSSDIFYVIAVGEAELVLARDDGVGRIVGRIGPGGHFGETGILTGKPRSVGVRSLGDLVVICFDKRYFKRSLLANSRIHNRLDALLAERLRVAFRDQMDSAGDEGIGSVDSGADDVILFKDRSFSAFRLRRLIERKNEEIKQSRTARKTQEVIDRFAANDAPYLLTGETGTGKSIIAREIHLQSERADGPYREMDLREYEPLRLERKLFGTEQSGYPFARARRAGILEQTSGGTLVFTHAHLMEGSLQERIIKAIDSSTFTHMDTDRLLAMQSRIVFISGHPLQFLRSTEKFLPRLLDFFDKQHFEVQPLREHKEDLPRLISFYLGKYSKEYGKKISRVSSETLGILMNYDWPGNLTELSSVIRRAVMLAKQDEILPAQILLGLPKTEGKWEYNLLRIPWIAKFLRSAIFPRIPQVIVGFFLFVTILTLFFGPKEARSNTGLTLGWYIGWPLMFFSFFFLARTWCSVCTLAVPGTLVQNLVKPSRKTPLFIKKNSGWIMALLCILVFWIEIVWDAYNSPFLTGGIILIITVGSLVTSVLYSRRTWCRYLCPLGAVNAIFAMPSIVELRANRHVCLNRCKDHSCFAGDSSVPGCPMFRHPYLVDNNRDCIMCAKCIKNCDNSSIQLNVRLAPEELWALATPRNADSFLVVSMTAIFFPFALKKEFSSVAEWLVSMFSAVGIPVPDFIASSLIFFVCIFIFQLGYYLMVSLQSFYAKMDKKLLLPLFGYGFIPMILGGYLAVHLEFFVSGAGRILPNIQEWLGLPFSYENIRLLSPDSTAVLKTLTVLGGFFASLYATFRVIERALAGDPLHSRALVIPFSFLIIIAGLFVFMV
jgi:polyferredoxin/CRP-like cAMP-binding protein